MSSGGKGADWSLKPGGEGQVWATPPLLPVSPLPAAMACLSWSSRLWGPCPRPNTETLAMAPGVCSESPPHSPLCPGVRKRQAVRGRGRGSESHLSRRAGSWFCGRPSGGGCTWRITPVKGRNLASWLLRLPMIQPGPAAFSPEVVPCHRCPACPRRRPPPASVPPTGHVPNEPWNQNEVSQSSHCGETEARRGEAAWHQLPA